MARPRRRGPIAKLVDVWSFLARPWHWVEFLLPGGEMAGESKNGGEQGGDWGEG